MICRRYVDLISRYVDDAITERERKDLLDHLQRCPECAATLARYRQTAVLARGLPESSPSHWVRPTTLRAVGAVEGRKSAIARYVVVLAALVFAAGLFAVVGGSSDRQTIAGTPRAVSADTAPGGGNPDGQRVVEALRESFDEPGRRPPLPSYLPLGAKVEQMSLQRAGGNGDYYKVDLALRLSDGGSLVVRQLPSVGRPVPPPSQAGTILISGREWRYLRRDSPGYGEPPVHVLVGELDGAIVEIESALPLADLVRVAESMD